MARAINVFGRGEEIVIAVDGEEKAFSRGKDISADELFGALRYVARDRYDIQKGVPGDVPADVFDVFYKLIDEVINGINELAATDNNSDEAGSDARP